MRRMQSCANLEKSSHHKILYSNRLHNQKPITRSPLQSYTEKDGGKTVTLTGEHTQRN